MPRATRTRRTAPGSVELLDPLPDLEDSSLDDKSAQPQIDFFDYLDQLNQAERSQCLVYIYRQKPEIRNAEGKAHYIDKVSPPIDEDYVKTHHGGGQYMLWLKNMESKDVMRKHTFTIDGPPVIPLGTVLLDGATGQPVSAIPTSAAQPAAADGVVRELLQALTPLIQSKGPAVSPDELLNSGMEVMRKAMGNAVQIMAETASSTAKRNADSATGNPFMDALLQKALKSITDPAPARNPMEDFKTMLQTMKEMQTLTGEDRRPRSEGMLDQLKGVAEILKTDSDGTIRNLIFGREDAEPASIGAGLLKLGEALISRRPDIVDSAANLLQRFSTSPGAAVQPARQPGAPALAGVVQPGVPAMQPAAPSLAPQPSREEMMINGILQSVVKGYNGNNSGDAVAISLRMLFQEEVALFAPYLSLPDTAVFTWMRAQPSISAIVDLEDFPEFYADFKAELLRVPEPDPAPEPELPPS